MSGRTKHKHAVLAVLGRPGALALHLWTFTRLPWTLDDIVAAANNRQFALPDAGRQAVSASHVDNVVECMLPATGGLNRNLTLNHR
jgi:hypothetical protein